jgi:long-subunit acyl-CoA synthetase (AMP-forming)
LPHARRAKQMPKETRETVDAAGWCHTGDIGIWLTSGQLRIVDRKKNMFKLSQGEYIAAERVREWLVPVHCMINKGA